MIGSFKGARGDPFAARWEDLRWPLGGVGGRRVPRVVPNVGRSRRSCAGSVFCARSTALLLGAERLRHLLVAGRLPES
jgi:hypothetical protein